MFDRKVHNARLYKLKESKNKTQAKLGENFDFTQKHPSEVREASKDNPTFTELKKRVKEEHDKNIKKYNDRRIRIGQRAHI